MDRLGFTIDDRPIPCQVDEWLVDIGQKLLFNKYYSIGGKPNYKRFKQIMALNNILERGAACWVGLEDKDIEERLRKLTSLK